MIATLKSVSIIISLNVRAPRYVWSLLQFSIVMSRFVTYQNFFLLVSSCEMLALWSESCRSKILPVDSFMLLIIRSIQESFLVGLFICYIRLQLCIKFLRQRLSKVLSRMFMLKSCHEIKYVLSVQKSFSYVYYFY